jgi:hypothetical protein
MNDQSYSITFLSRANLYCFLFLAFPTLLNNEVLHQQLWGYKVVWRSVSRGTGGKMLKTIGLRHVTVFYRSNIAIAGSNPARSMDVCVRVSVLRCPVFR